MSTRPGIPAVVAVACAAVLLAGCSSSGTVGAGSASDGTGGVTGTSGGSAGTGGTTGGSGGGDTGCNQALLAIQNAEKAQNSANPQAALKGVNTSISQLRAAALTTKKPGGKDAMNKVADDLQNIMNAAEANQQPDTQQALNDAQVVATLCGA